MFEVSAEAAQVLAAYLEERRIEAPVRITPMSGNCAGPHLRLRTGQIKEDDHVFRQDGITFVVNQELLAECGAIRMDYMEPDSPCCCSGGCAGFRISGKSKYPFAGRCSTDASQCDHRCGLDEQEQEALQVFEPPQ
jgi:Fe-S cluster assembly iron-binding protein IscA